LVGKFGPRHEGCVPGISGSALSATSIIISHAVDFSIVARSMTIIIVDNAGSARFADKFVSAPVSACVLDMLKLAHLAIAPLYGIFRFLLEPSRINNVL